MSMIRRRSRPIDSQQARLRVRRRVPPLAALFPFVRWIATMTLVIGVVFGITRFFTQPSSVGALEFTPHIIGKDKSALGVKGVAVGDMTGNGILDVVTAGQDGVKVYTSSDKKNWQTVVVDSLSAERVQLVDLSQNGKLDILVTLRDSNPSVKWYSNQGDLSFVGFFIGTGEAGVAAAADLNNNGFIDVVTATRQQGGEIILRRWMNAGLNMFIPTTMTDDATGEAATDSGVKAIAIGNVNCGAYPDIVTVGEKALNYWTTSNGSSWTKIDVPGGDTGGSYISIGDLTKDTRQDIVVADRIAQSIFLYRNLDCQEFKKIEVDTEVDAVSVVMEDLNKNGTVDLVVAASDDNSVLWYDHDGSQNFTKKTLADNVRNVFGLALADISGNGEWDFVTGDQVRGTVYWYERLRARPRATAPTNIRQTTDGSGRIIFETTIADIDMDPTRIRVQYSINGDHWYKPWITKVTPSHGSVDLKNSNGYQIGTSNPIATDKNESVTLTIVWDTKTIENTGGPIVGDVNTVQLRVIPRDDLSIGPAAVSSKFRVDNQAPQGLDNVRITAIDNEKATIGWDVPQDSSSFKYLLYYGTNHAAVLERRSEVWDENSSDSMGESFTNSTTVTDLQAGQTYSFKLYVRDIFGNMASAPSVTGGTFATSGDPDSSPPSSDPPPVPPPGDPSGPTPFPTAVPPPSDPDDPFEFPTPTPPVSDDPGEDPFEPDVPTGVNNPPIASAGDDILVNPVALIILDGTGSLDPDGSTLSYNWQQIDGPPIELKSPRTATPSFTAGSGGEVYIFALTVRDPEGESDTDLVTVAVRQLSQVEDEAPVDSEPADPDDLLVDEERSFLIAGILHPLNLLLFFLSILATLISLMERFVHSWSKSKASKPIILASGRDIPTGKVVHYKTGEPIADVQVFVYGADKKLRATERTNNKGEFNSLFPAGDYSIDVKSDEFTFAPTVSGIMKPDSGILYTGGSLVVKDGSKPLNIIIPMKPVGKEVSTGRTSFLHNWQAIQHMGRMFSWPLFLIGASLNTILIFIEPTLLYLVIEVFYVILVIIKISMEVNMRPAYGLVRDAITHVPLDLAVIRLFEKGTNRLVMTRVTNAQGKFFALPPSGKYTITITKPGYAVFSKQDIDIVGQQDSTLQITADLMPVAPQRGGLQAARAAVL